MVLMCLGVYPECLAQIDRIQFITLCIYNNYVVAGCHIYNMDLDIFHAYPAIALSVQISIPLLLPV